GRRLLLLLHVQPDGWAETIPLGLISLALAAFLLAALQLLTAISIFLVLLCLAIAAYGTEALSNKHVVASLSQVWTAWPLKEQFRIQISPDLRLPLLLIAPVIFLNLTWAVTPEIQFDAGNYHLAISQTYVRNHGFVDVPYSFHSYFYRLIDMLFTIAIALHG